MRLVTTSVEIGTKAFKSKKEGHSFTNWYQNIKARDLVKDVVIEDLPLYFQWIKGSFMNEKIAKRCIIKGYADGISRPNKNLPRA